MESKLFQWLKGSKKQLSPKDSPEKETCYRVQLVAGLFDPSESAELLLSLLNYKIKFHTVQLLNMDGNDREGREKSEKRIAQLKKAKQEVTDIVVNAKNQGLHLEIMSDIALHPKKVY